MFVKSKVDKPIATKTKHQGYYCKKGDKLKVIADHDNVLIVEFNNNKFSIKKEDTNEC